MVKTEKRRVILVIGIILTLGILINSVFAADAPPFSGFNPFGSGSSGDMQNLMQIAQQILSVVQQMLGNLKTNLQSNMQAGHDRLAKINAPRLVEDSASLYPAISAINVNKNRVALNFTDMELTLEDRNTGNKIIVYNRPGSVANVNTNSSLENIMTANTTTIITKNGVDLGIVKVGNETTLIDDGGATVNNSQIPSSNGIVTGFLPLVSASELDNAGGFFSEQYIVFIEDDIFINGKNILFFPLKPFDKIIVSGSKLHLMEKDVDIIVFDNKIYYSRVVGESDFPIGKIINEKNPGESFGLHEGGTRGSYFVEGNNILTVGEDVVENPLEGYEHVLIPKSRLEMWER